MNVVGIDAGFRNFAYAHLHSDASPDWRTPVAWAHEDWGRFQSMDWLRRATLQWCRRNQRMLDNADAIVLERQMKKKFMVQNRYPLRVEVRLCCPRREPRCRCLVSPRATYHASTCAGLTDKSQ